MIEGLKPYPGYRQIPLRWLPAIPGHWGIQRGKVLFRESTLAVRDGDGVVTCFRDGQVTLRTNRRTTGFTNAILEGGYQGVRCGQLVIHAMDAFAGAIGVSDSDGKCTPEYAVCDPVTDANPYYYAWLLREAARREYILIECPAVRERAPRFRFPSFGRMSFPVPPLDEQAAIVKFIDYADRRIRRYIRAKQKLLRHQSEAVASITQWAATRTKIRRMRLSTVASQVIRRVTRDVETVYTPVGLYNRGRGMFAKTPLPGTELGDSEFFWLQPGDLILSGQFAWEGAVAMVTPEYGGCVASHRYPVLRARPDVALTPYLLAFFRSSYGHLLLDINSRGAAGRNRPLNVPRLMKEKVPIPPMEAQAKVLDLLQQEAALRAAIAREVALVTEYRTRLIADVVTGKLDVRRAAADLPDELDADEPELADTDELENTEEELPEEEAAE